MTQFNEHLPGLDFLRSIAIVWVMLFHSFVVGGLGPQYEWLSRYGWMGVDLFFVLSGYLIGVQVLKAFAAGRAFSFAEFYARRAFRILPAYLAVLMLYAFWPAFREAPGLEPSWKFLSFSLNLDIDYDANAAFSHAWSLCVEEQFYLFFPVLTWLCCRRLGHRRFAMLCMSVVAAGAVLRGAAWLRDANANPPLDRNWFIEDIYYPTWNRLDGLLAGVVLATWRVMGPQHWTSVRRHANRCLVSGIALLAIAMVLFNDRVGLLANTIGWPVLSLAWALLVFATADSDHWLGRLQIPGAKELATISYSLYLVHKAVYHLVAVQWGEQFRGEGFMAVLAYGAAAVLAACLLHCTIERPFLRMRDWLGRHRRSKTDPGVSSVA